MSFSDLQLAPQILKALTECGYATPTPIQAQAIPEALAGRDVLASAQTGTGKTAAFLLPSLQRLLTPVRNPKGAPRILVLTPTRELAQQITDCATSYGKYLRMRSALILGGMPYRDQFRALSQPLDLVVATPGRLVDHLDRGSLDLSRVEILVLDEADRMLDMGFKDDLEKVTARVPQGRQTLFFTATLDKVMVDLAARLLHDPVRIDIAAKKENALAIEQRLYVADSLSHKQRLLQHMLADEGVTRAIIFSATKRDADGLARELSAQGHRAAALHGDMSQGNRSRTLKMMRQGRIRLLVATDVAARGLDITDISHVINFDLPKFAEDYVHRIGRTGRAGATGTAVSFASRHDLTSLQRIERYIGKAVPKHVVPGMEPSVSLDLRSASGRRPDPRRDGRTRKPFPGSSSRFNGRSAQR
jgi:superfamily II DNA/RNA helicase